MSSLVCYKSRYSIRTHSLCYKFYYKTRACLIASYDTYGFTHSRAKRRQLWMRFFVIAPAEGKPTRDLFFLAKFFATVHLFSFFLQRRKKRWSCARSSIEKNRPIVSGVRRISPEIGMADRSNTQIASLCGVFGPREARITFVANEFFVEHVTSSILENNLSMLLLFLTQLDIHNRLYFKELIT